MFTLFLLVLMTRPFIGGLCFDELLIPVMTAATTRFSCADRTLLSSTGLDVVTDLIRRLLLDFILSIFLYVADDAFYHP